MQHSQHRERPLVSQPLLYHIPFLTSPTGVLARKQLFSHIYDSLLARLTSVEHAHKEFPASHNHGLMSYASPVLGHPNSWFFRPSQSKRRGPVTRHRVASSVGYISYFLTDCMVPTPTPLPPPSKRCELKPMSRAHRTCIPS